MKDIPGFEGQYAITQDGRVWSHKTQKWRVPRLGRYCTVTLSLPGRRLKAVYVHRVLAMAWIPNPESKPQVNHIDGNKMNNRVENLEWVTRKENTRHAWQAGLCEKTRKANSKPVQCVETGEVFLSAAAAAKALGYNLSTIASAVGRGTRSAGLHWRYV